MNNACLIFFPFKYNMACNDGYYPDIVYCLSYCIIKMIECIFNCCFSSCTCNSLITLKRATTTKLEKEEL